MNKRVFVFLLVLTLITPNLFSYTDKPVAVVLAGGGARGAYQIGVWKALIDLDVNIGAVYGVSVGAINGAVMAAGNFELARDLWLRLENDKIMNASDATKKVLEGTFSLQELAGAVFNIYARGGLDVSPLESLLRQYIDEDTVRNSGVDFGLAAFSVTDSKQKFFRLDDIPEGRLVDYILASANFPIFQRKIIDGEEFIDGGIQNNMVVELIDTEKYKHAVIVTLNLYTPEDLRDLLLGYEDYNFDVKTVIPAPDLGSLLDFSPSNSLSLMRMGYLDALKSFGKISGIGYYIYGKDTIRKMFLKLSPQQRRNAVEMLEVDVPWFTDFSNGDQIFDQFVDVELLRLGENNAALLEMFLLGLGVRRDILYSEAELLNIIVDNYIHRSNSRVYKNRHLDFLSYITLNSGEIVYSDGGIDSKFMAGYKGFMER